MTGKERLHAEAGGPMEWLKCQWRNRRALWIGLAVLIVLLLQLQILASLGKMNRELDSMEYVLYRMAHGMEDIGEHVGANPRDWTGGIRSPGRSRR